MWKPRWLLALPLALAATVGTAHASSVRDQAGLFSADALRQAEAELNRVERETQLTTTVETVGSLEGENVAAATERHAEKSGTHGLYVLIAKNEGKIDVKSSSAFRRSMDRTRLNTIMAAFVNELMKRDFDAALLKGVKAIGSEATAAKAELGSLRQGNAPARRVGAGGPVGRPANPNRGGFGLGSLLGIGLVIIGVLFVVRLLGSLFGAGRGHGGQPGRMGGPGYGAGYGGGGGGGGFMSSLFGGIGGAMAGNWLYDQFSGRHGGGTSDSSTYGDAGSAPAADDGSGGANTSGDWGGGDAGGGGGGGGGGDWGGGGGGGGGDWGGGGDSGGGGGGGDW